MTPVVQRVDTLLLQIEQVASPTVREVASRRRAALHDPLRLAVVGRVKAGKSTLVNALIGRRIAPTRAGECTRVVTWFEFGSPDGAAVVHCHDGREIPISLVDGRLPEDLPVPAEQVKRLVVRLQSASLRGLTLIDTPGLSSLTRENEEVTRSAVLGDSLTSQHASGDADAVLFLFRQEQREDEADFLKQFRAASGEMNGSAVNAVGVLSQADLLADAAGDDPMRPARDQARRLATSRIGEVGDVVPVSGLLAETSRTGRLRERDVVDLATLAEVAPVRLRTGVGLDAVLAKDRVRDLQDKLGPFGLEAGRLEASEGSDRFGEWLSDVSGIDGLQRLVRDHVQARAGGLKALRALDAVERAARHSGADQAVLDLVEQALVAPELQIVREIQAIGMLRSTRVATDLIPELERLSRSDHPAEQLGLGRDTPAAEIASEARRRSGEAQTRATLAYAPGEAEAARVLAQSYRAIAQRAESPEPLPVPRPPVATAQPPAATAQPPVATAEAPAATARRVPPPPPPPPG
ncbi:dynamin family protein [Aeromicrobium alkaliterrae]|uniref:Dynamin family protein n=1 Tax=Aeromicrobium alkaliterrae TaxID=302168 RepID=A0ABN2JUU6_9ACTN